MLKEGRTYDCTNQAQAKGDARAPHAIGWPVTAARLASIAALRDG